MSLYREFRPKKLSEITGQTSIITTIKNQIDTGNISHAYLFSGPRGIGKTSIAKILSRAVNCEHYAAHQKGQCHGEIPCNECSICKDILADTCMDVIEMDAASNNGVDDIRAINDLVQFPPSTCRYKVLIIDEVHMLSKSAFNALLKTLEEPPEYIIFVLATTEANKIPPTILSRCQRYDFRKMNEDEILQRLEYVCRSLDRQYDPPALKLIANRAEGAMRDALSILDQCLSYSNYLNVENVCRNLGLAGDSFLLKLLSALDDSNLSDVLKLLKNANSEGIDPKQLIEHFSIMLQKIIEYRIEEKTSKDVSDLSQELQNYLNRKKNLNIQKLIDFQHKLLFTSYDIKNSSNTWIAAECMFLDLTAFQYQHDIRSLQIRISELETEWKNLQAGMISQEQKQEQNIEPNIPNEVFQEDFPVDLNLTQILLDEQEVFDEGIFCEEVQQNIQKNHSKENFSKEELHTKTDAFSHKDSDHARQGVLNETDGFDCQNLDLQQIKTELLDIVSKKMQHLYMPIQSSSLSYVPFTLLIAVASEYDFVVPMANTLQNTSVLVDMLKKDTIKEIKFDYLKTVPVLDKKTKEFLQGDLRTKYEDAQDKRDILSQKSAENQNGQNSKTRRVEAFFDKIFHNS